MLLRHKWIAALFAVLMIVYGVSSALAVTPDDYDKDTPQNLVEDHLYAESAMMIDAETGDVLFSKNPNARMYPASTTKIMTLLLALESGISLDTPITIPQQAAQIPSDSSLVPVLPGDQMTFRDLLYGFMLSSGNDGANAVAVIVGGSLESFVERMNNRATELGCTDTHFVNAHGYHDDQHYTTAHDLALITQAAVKLDMFRTISATPTYTMNIQRKGELVQPKILNKTAMVNAESTYYYEDCIGIKTGTTSKAGYCFVGAAERDGVRLITVDLKCEADAQKWYDTARMFEYGFTLYTDYTLEQMFEFASDQIATVKISNAIQSDPQGGVLDLNIAQISDRDYSRMVQSGNQAAMERAIADFVSRSELVITDDLVAPVSEGEILGNFRYVAQSGEEITALLIASRSVDEQPKPVLLSDYIPFLKNFENPLFRILLIVLAALIILIAISIGLNRARQARRRQEIYEARRREYLRQQRERQRRAPQSRRHDYSKRPSSHGSRRNTAIPRKNRPPRSDDDDLFGNF